MGDDAAGGRPPEMDREALAEANAEMLEVYNKLANSYAATIAQHNEVLEHVEGTLHRVREIIDRTQGDVLDTRAAREAPPSDQKPVFGAGCATDNPKESGDDR